ncbi:MAG: ATP-dependent DNA helicase RecG [Acidobacteria bacterium]|nr:ATP-dependent DNA helicase RecG [Acidobacteriota bacterium]
MTRAPDHQFLTTPLQYIKGVGPRRAADLERVALHSVEDLLCRFPLRYEDRGHLQPIASIQPDRPVTIAGEIVSCGLRPTRRPGFKIFEALVRDSSGYVRAAWLNQPFLRDVFQRKQQVILFGIVARGPGGPQFTNPQYEIVDHLEERDTVHTGRIVPVYERAGSMTPKMQRRLVWDLLQRLPDAIDDPLPLELRAEHHLPDRRAAFMQTHFPDAGTPLEVLHQFRTPAQRRLIFEEFFLFEFGLLLRRQQNEGERKPFVPKVDDRIRASARSVLPFKLTEGQRQALKEIVDDMQRPRPMNRLLQGDVGAGKTIVALLAALVAMENGLQVAFMAPTEILAEQHFLTIRRLLEASHFRVGALTGATSSAARREVLEQLASHQIDLVVGTHALVQETVTFARLGLGIIDEQHRFGVLQRATLRAKGLNPDVLVMTATPIPRTLALTVYGELDVSVIRELPPGRRPIKTLVEPESRRPEIHEFIRKELDAGRQAYVIYPLVEESSKIDLKAATEMADHLAHDVFPAFRVALLHGRMKQDAKDRVMRAFAAGEIQLLVSTTVVEVGVDVPNASVMLVEHAERFGLSQLHQLRGRVGRGTEQSSCVMMYQAPLSEQARERLKAVADTTDGFVLAEKDLQLRGPGDFFGTRQAGMPTLRAGDLLRDFSILDEARQAAQDWIARDAARGRIVAFVRDSWEARFGLVGVG